MHASRRRFLCCAGGLASAGGAAILDQIWRSRSTATSGEDGPIRIHNGGLVSCERSARALGTQVTLTALARDGAAASAGVDAAFAEIERVESAMSLYRPSSQLCRLNRQGRLDNPHPYLVEVLKAATEMSRRSGGAFDVTVQPMWELFAASRDSGKLPTDDQLNAARARVNWRRVELTQDAIHLGGGAAITLNGIAQGYAADRALAALRAHGVAHALVDTGELNSLGRPQQDRPWTVGIQHPRAKDAYLAVAELAGRSLATSGDYATPFTPDFRWHHLFDPRTGRSATELASVSVAAPTGMQADALSTAIFVLGLDAGLALAKSLDEVDALIADKSGRVVATPGFPRASV